MSKKTDVTKSKKGLSRYISVPQVLKNDKEKSKFLTLLVKNKGKIRPTAKAFGISYQSVYNRRRTDPEFDLAVVEVQALYIEELGEKLEMISEEQAEDPKNITERHTQLKALKPEKYNPHRNRGDHFTQINITTTSPRIEDRVDPYKEVKNE
jgi:hypothetical protein